jgi:hypothetical protein
MGSSACSGELPTPAVLLLGKPEFTSHSIPTVTLQAGDARHLEL